MGPHSLKNPKFFFPIFFHLVPRIGKVKVLGGNRCHTDLTVLVQWMAKLSLDLSLSVHPRVKAYAFALAFWALSSALVALSMA